MRRSIVIWRAFFAALALCLTLAPLADAEVRFSEPPKRWQSKDVLKWTVFDVDEGDAMLLECGGEAMLVDGGPAPFRKMLYEALQSRGIDRLRYMLNTHYHDDHISGLVYLLEQGFKADVYMHPYLEGEQGVSRLHEKAVACAKRNGMSVSRLLNGDSIKLGGARIDVYRCTEYSNVNAKSLMLGVTFDKSRLLLCADITGLAQRYFVDALRNGELSAQIIKLPHHAITPMVNEFADTVAPVAAVATGKQRSIKSKSKAQLERNDIAAFYSGDGTVCAVTDGTDWYIYQPEEE